MESKYSIITSNSLREVLKYNNEKKENEREKDRERIERKPNNRENEYENEKASFYNYKPQSQSHIQNLSYAFSMKNNKVNQKIQKFNINEEKQREVLNSTKRNLSTTTASYLGYIGSYNTIKGVYKNTPLKLIEDLMMEYYVCLVALYTQTEKHKIELIKFLVSNEGKSKQKIDLNIVFSKLTHGKGFLTQKSFDEILEELGISMNFTDSRKVDVGLGRISKMENQVEQVSKLLLFAYLDRNDDGRIDYSDFLESITPVFSSFVLSEIQADSNSKTTSKLISEESVMKLLLSSSSRGGHSSFSSSSSYLDIYSKSVVFSLIGNIYRSIIYNEIQLLEIKKEICKLINPNSELLAFFNKLSYFKKTFPVENIIEFLKEKGINLFSLYLTNFNHNKNFDYNKYRNSENSEYIAYNEKKKVHVPVDRFTSTNLINDSNELNFTTIIGENNLDEILNYLVELIIRKLNRSGIGREVNLNLFMKEMKLN